MRLPLSLLVRKLLVALVALSASITPQVLTAGGVAAAPAGVDVYVGYADNLRANPVNFPTPWQNSPGVQFQGCAQPCELDAAAVRIVNGTTGPVIVDSITLHFSVCSFTGWSSTMLPAGGQLIITALGGGGGNGCANGPNSINLVDSSDFGPNGAPWAGVCTQSHVIPTLDVSLNGTVTSYSDTAQVLNTGGVDLASCSINGRPAGNESTQWSKVGTATCPGATLALDPPTQQHQIGQSATINATFLNSCGQPLSGANVQFAVTGVNPTTGANSTDSNGHASFTYVGNHTGTDSVQGSVSNAAGSITSNTVTVTWIGLFSLALNGTTAYAEAPHDAALNITGNWTVEMWFKDEDPAGFNHALRELLNKGDHDTNPESPYYILIGNNHLLAGVRSAGVDHPIDADLAFLGLDPSKWHHVAVTYRADLQVLNLWLDGTHISYLSGVPNSAGNTLPLEIGRNGPTAGKYWMGKLDDLRIYNVARTGADIDSDFQAELNSVPSGLVANWKFDEGSGSVAMDSVAGRTATLNGGATFSTDVHP